MDIKKFIKQAHKSADIAIMKAQIKVKIEDAKQWLMTDIVIKRAYFAAVYVSLFGFIAYEIAIY